MQMYEDIFEISLMLDTEELLDQLAEECMELSLAAYENFEMEMGTRQNDCSTKLKTTKDKLEEETADVGLVWTVLKERLTLSDTEIAYCSRIIDQAEEDGLHENIFAIQEKLKTKPLVIGKMAMKLRRARTKKNPTPITAASARLDLIFAMSKLRGTLNALARKYGFENIRNIEEEKAARWLKRLKDAAEQPEEGQKGETGGMGNEGVYEDRPEFLGK